MKFAVGKFYPSQQTNKEEEETKQEQTTKTEGMSLFLLEWRILVKRPVNDVGVEDVKEETQLL